MFSTRIFRKYAFIIMLLIGSVLIFGAAIELGFNYRESRAQIEQLQRAEAKAAAVRIAEFLHGIERLVRDVSSLPWTSANLGLEDRREEYHRLLKLVPAIAEIRAVDAEGREKLRISRQDVDEIMSNRDNAQPNLVKEATSSGMSYGPTYFKYGSEPFMLLAVRDQVLKDQSTALVNLVELNLKFASDVIREIHPAANAKAYVVDSANHLVSHPDISTVLRRSDLSNLPQVAEMRRLAYKGEVMSAPGFDVEGVSVLAAFAPVDVAGWWVAVEQPLSDALRPVYGTLYRTAILFLVGIVIALAASSLLARRLVQPILTLKNGASRIGRGELATRIHIETGDEIEILANEFNMMAGKLQESYAGLEQKVAEKTSQLTLANRHKSEFLANMSHELRTPLNAIIGFSDVLREQYFGPLNQKQLEYVRDINASGQHLLSLINDILDLSKIEAGRMDLDLSTFSLPGTIEQALVLVRERAANKGLRLKSTIGDDVGLITADERKVKQILINLLSNAVKFSDAGGWVEVNVSRSSNGSVISVKDNGIGIAAEDQTAVFEEFKQLKTSGSAKQEGTGLGLPMSRKLTELHGGRIWVESEVGHGATFTFTLPDIPASLPQSK